MAVDMFLKLEGVTGESQDKVHTKEIDVLAWSWGMSNSGTAHVGGGAGSGKCNVQDLSFSKYVDSSSPKLMLNCCNGTHVAKGLLTVSQSRCETGGVHQSQDGNNLHHERGDWGLWIRGPVD